MTCTRKIRSVPFCSRHLFAISLLVPLTACDAITDKLTEVAVEEAIEATTQAEDVDIDSETGKVSIKTKDGTLETNKDKEGTVSFQGVDGSTATVGGELPKDFPLPLVEAHSVLQSAVTKNDRGKNQVLMMVAKSRDLAELDAIYTQALEKLGELKRTEIKQGDGGMTFLQVKNKSTGISAGVQMTRGEKSEGVNLVLTYEEKSPKE